MAADKIPDVVLIKKVYGEKALRNRKRKWKLKHLNDELHDQQTNKKNGGGNGNDDYTEFLADLEEDAEFRQNVNIYKDPRKTAVDTDATSEAGDVPQITLAEMMDDLALENMESSWKWRAEYMKSSWKWRTEYMRDESVIL